MFNRLAPPLQRALWELGWQALRDNQVAALPLILDTQDDVVVSAATAAGKTEAAFLPLLTRLWQGQPVPSKTEASVATAGAGPKGLILYVAPVKALINDQVERLHIFCDRMDIPVYPWHGDVGQTSRKKFFADPRGVVLITPESLESLLFRRGADLRQLFAGLQAVVADELHAFIGNVRGCQLQSLLHRLETQLGRRVQRIGLSATLGDMGLAAEFCGPATVRRSISLPPQAKNANCNWPSKPFCNPTRSRKPGKMPTGRLPTSCLTGCAAPTIWCFRPVLAWWSFTPMPCASAARLPACR